jgi:hypothetical protein
MPVHQMLPPAPAKTIPPEQRRSLLEKLKREREGPATPGGPVIFEIPIDGPERIDVLVVWEEWQGVQPDDRTGVILEAYADRRDQIRQPMGVTYEEAMRDQLLPYAVVSQLENEELLSLLIKNDAGRVEPEEAAAEKVRSRIRDVKLKHGGIRLPNGSVELRFPARAMADNVHRELFENEKSRSGYWSVVHT